MKEYIALWKNYVNFGCRTTRRGYWMAMLINFLVSWVISFISLTIDNTGLLSIYSAAVFIPSVAITIRRLRDAGRHWAWIFIGLVPAIGWIVLLVMMCQPSIPQNNIPQV